MQSLRVVDRIEKDGAGLNLCYETRMGILTHSGEKQPETLEAAVVRLSDKIAYINHDTDDALRAGILAPDDIPGESQSLLGTRYSRRINAMIVDVIRNSAGKNAVSMSPEMYFVMESFHDFMFENVYRNEKAKGEERKVQGMLEAIYGSYVAAPEKLEGEYAAIAAEEGVERAVCDYIAGMTDTFAISLFKELFVPGVWSVL